jgi:hypothetical protein
MIMEYNEEQHITTDSTITTYILQHSCYSSVCLIAYASEQEFIKRLVTIYIMISFFLLHVKYLALGLVTIYIM